MTQINATMVRDGNNMPVPSVIVGETLATTVDATISSATDITLNASTTYIEVSAIAKGIYLKYGTTASSLDFDEYISQDTTRGFAVTGGSTISVIEQAATASVVIVEK
jgi:hypothetical protein